MPSKKPFLSFVIDEELLKKIDDFKFANRFDSRAEAIRYLIEKGLSDNVTAESAPTFETQKKKPTARRTGGGRFSIKPYVNTDGRTIDCPACGSRISRTNFSRHARDAHGKTSQEILEGSQE